MEKRDGWLMNFINKMIMRFGTVMKQIHEDAFVVIAEGCNYIWIWKTLIRHGGVIKLKNFVDVDFSTHEFTLDRLQYFIMWVRSLDLVKYPHHEDSIIYIWSTVLGTFTILFDVFHFYIRILFSAIHLVKCLGELRVLQIELINMVFSIIPFRHSDCPWWVISNHDRNNWIFCHNSIRSGQIVKHVAIILKVAVDFILTFSNFQIQLIFDSFIKDALKTTDI